MRILFLNNMLGQCGGITNNLQIAKRLGDMGNEVYVRYPYAPTKSAYHKSRRLLGRALRSCGLMAEKKAHWMDAGNLDIKIVPSLEKKHLPQADAVVFSWWEVAYDALKLKGDYKTIIYYAQHYEGLWGGSKDLVDATYGMGFRILANSIWTKRQIESLGVSVGGLLYPGVSSKFYPKGKEHDGICLGTPYRPDCEWKGYSDVVKAVEIVKRERPDLVLKTFGIKSPPPQDISLYCESPTDEELCDWYNSCNAFVCGSWYEGFASPTLEAMRCKTPTSSTRVGILDDSPDCGAFISEPRDVNGLAENILYILDHPEESEERAKRGYDFALQFTWERAAKALLESLIEA